MNSRHDRYAHLEWRATPQHSARSTWNRTKAPAKRRSLLALILAVFA